MTAVGVEFIALLFRGLEKNFSFNLYHPKYCLKLQKKKVFVKVCRSLRLYDYCKNAGLNSSMPVANLVSRRQFNT
jgi:hypothetical protein